MPTTDILPDTLRMSHRTDPHTSHEAAERTAKSTKRELLYGAILFALRVAGPATPAEVLNVIVRHRLRFEQTWLPVADLYDIRRRMTELDRDQHRIEPIQVGTQRNGKPQYQTRFGQRVMRLTGAVAT